MIELFIPVIIAAFIFQFLDASAGMGYGTLTPILILMGYSALDVVSAMILSSAILSLFAGLLHHNFKNTDYLNKRNFKILSTLILFGIASIVIGSFVSINIPANALKTYIGILIIVIGLSIIISQKEKLKFSWKRLIAFGSLASFNKGMSGGGFGPVLAGGQIVSGIKAKQAVGITVLSEGVISSIGFLAHLFISGANSINWMLIISLLIGGIISTPFAVYFVKQSHPKFLKRVIAVTSIVLGLIIITKIYI